MGCVVRGTALAALGNAAALDSFLDRWEQARGLPFINGRQPGAAETTPPPPPLISPIGPVGESRPLTAAIFDDLGSALVVVEPESSVDVAPYEEISPTSTPTRQAVTDALAGDVEARFQKVGSVPGPTLSEIAAIEPPWDHRPDVRARLARWRTVHLVAAIAPVVEVEPADEVIHEHTIWGTDAGGARAELQVRSVRNAFGALYGGIRVSVRGVHRDIGMSPEAIRVLERELVALRRALADDLRRREAAAPEGSSP